MSRSKSNTITVDFHIVRLPSFPSPFRRSFAEDDKNTPYTCRKVTSYLDPKSRFLRSMKEMKMFIMFLKRIRQIPFKLYEYVHGVDMQKI